MSSLPCSSLPGLGSPRWSLAPGEPIRTEEGGDRGPGGLCWDTVLVALFTRASFWLPVSKPPGNALSVEAQIKRHYPHALSVKRVSYSRGRGRQLVSAVDYCHHRGGLYGSLQQLCICSGGSSGTEVPAVLEVWTENTKVTWSVQRPSYRDCGRPRVGGKPFPELGGSSWTRMIARACVTPGVWQAIPSVPSPRDSVLPAGGPEVCARPSRCGRVHPWHRMPGISATSCPCLGCKRPALPSAPRWRVSLGWIQSLPLLWLMLSLWDSHLSRLCGV